MRKSAEKSTQHCGKTPARVRDFLRRREPFKTAQAVETACAREGYRVPARTVERWLDGSSAPSGHHFCALIATYGLDVLEGVIPGAGWLTAARRAERRERYAQQRAALEAELGDP